MIAHLDKLAIKDEMYRIVTCVYNPQIGTIYLCNSKLLPLLF